MIICELDPPKTLALEKYFTGAQALVKAGCDAITLADNSLTILRVSNHAPASLWSLQNLRGAFEAMSVWRWFRFAAQSLSNSAA